MGANWNDSLKRDSQVNVLGQPRHSLPHQTSNVQTSHVDQESIQDVPYINSREYSTIDPNQLYSPSPMNPSVNSNQMVPASHLVHGTLQYLPQLNKHGMYQEQHPHQDIHH